MVASDQVLVTGKQLETLCINTIRTLAIDAVQQANSGHPGAPMGLAPVTYELWQNFLKRKNHWRRTANVEILLEILDFFAQIPLFNSSKIISILFFLRENKNAVFSQYRF